MIFPKKKKKIKLRITDFFHQLLQYSRHILNHLMCLVKNKLSLLIFAEDFFNKRLYYL